MIHFSDKALTFLWSNKPADAKLLRLGIIGGGCSGYSYTLAWAEKAEVLDKVFRFLIPLPAVTSSLATSVDMMSVIVDPISLMYLDGVNVSFSENPLQPGFTFDNPNAKKTCCCGSSFEAK